MGIRASAYAVLAQWKQLRFDGQRVGFVYPKSAPTLGADVGRAAASLGLTLTARAVESAAHDTGDAVATPELVAMMEAMGVPAPDYFPLLGGHEGAGVIEAVGPGVRSVQPGDHVSLSFIPACGTCRWCASGMTYLCDNGAMILAKEMVTDGTARRHVGDEDLMAMCQLGTFAEYAVLAEESVIKIDESIPFEAASLVSCGVATGWGSGTVGVGTQPGDTVVIVGTGGVGINAVQGARAAGANNVIAVDPVDFKRDTAKFFGATDTCPSMEAAFPLVQQLTRGVMKTAIDHGVDIVLAGSVRDDGPLPDVVTDMVEAQKRMREAVPGVRLALMLSTMLHSIATGNLLPAGVRTVCVDINPAVVTKLADRGSWQSIGLVTDVESFLRELVLSLQSEAKET